MHLLSTSTRRNAQRTLRTSTRWSSSSGVSTRESLRALLQHTAQAVSVLAVKSAPDSSALHHSEGDEAFHGATLSSFSSISFLPYPIVSFALQLPSRSADSLQTQLHAHASRNASFSGNSEDSSPPPSANLVLNLLSSSQPHLAVRFSRPDLYPKPFTESYSTLETSTPSPYVLTSDGLPVFTESLGALSCSLLSALPLREASDPTRLAEAIAHPASSPGDSKGSVLYLARVLRVEEPNEEWESLLPLTYHRRKYGTVGPLR